MNFQQQKNNFIKNLKLQESVSNDAIKSANMESDRRSTSPTSLYLEKRKTPLKLLHYHKKKGSV